MAEPIVDPSWFAKGAEWIVAAFGALLGVIWKANDAKHNKAADRIEKVEKAVGDAIANVAKSITDKIDHETRCFRIELKGKADADEIKDLMRAIEKSNQHIERLYQNNEEDRKEVRDLHNQTRDRIEKLASTIADQHSHVLEAMASCNLRPRG